MKTIHCCSNMKRTTRGVICALWVLATASSAYAAASVTMLGYLPGDNGSGAAGVSADGSVIVGYSSLQPYVGSATHQAFRWTSNSGMVALGHLPGDNASQACGVSADGLVVVGSSEGFTLDAHQAFRWTASSGMVGLGYLPGGTNSSATGVSSNGSVIVGTSSSSSGDQAFRWTAGSGMVGLGHLPGDSGSSASGVSADGSVIVGLSSSASGHQAFRWTAGTGMVGLGYLPGGTYSYAAAVSADGSVIVGTSSSASNSQAFRWTAGSGMVGLGYLPGGFYYSFATSVSGDGSVIGGTTGIQAFRWTAGSGIHSLYSAVLIANGIDPSGDWNTLYETCGISTDGNTLVGLVGQGDAGPFSDGPAFAATLPAWFEVRPLLSINSSRSTAHQLVLSWPTNYIGFTLQASTGLGSTNWTNCASPNVSGVFFAVTNPICAGAQFFRLKK
jgi:probable HAF family extracellular repeat protein